DARALLLPVAEAQSGRRAVRPSGRLRHGCHRVTVLGYELRRQSQIRGLRELPEVAMTSAEDPMAPDDALRLPFERDGVLTMSPTYARLREQAPVVRVTTPAGDPAWLVVAHDEAKSAFSDSRLGYYVHDDPEHAPRMTDAALHAAPMGGVDFEAESIRLRRLMAPGFTPKRTRLLEGWIQELTDGCLDDMEAAGD